MNELIRQAQMMQRKMLKTRRRWARRNWKSPSAAAWSRSGPTARANFGARLDPAVVDPNDVDMLQDLIMSAVNEAVKKGKGLMQSQMAQITGSRFPVCSGAFVQRLPTPLQKIVNQFSALPALGAEEAPCA